MTFSREQELKSCGGQFCSLFSAFGIKEGRWGRLHVGKRKQGRDRTVGWWTRLCDLLWVVMPSRGTTSGISKVWQPRCTVTLDSAGLSPFSKEVTGQGWDCPPRLPVRKLRFIVSLPFPSTASLPKSSNWCLYKVLSSLKLFSYLFSCSHSLPLPPPPTLSLFAVLPIFLCRGSFFLTWKPESTVDHRGSH